MSLFRTRGRRWWIASLAAALTALAASLWLASILDNALRTRLEAAALRHGMVAKVAAVHVGLWPLLRLEKLDLELGHGLHFRADAIAVTWPGRWRIAIRGSTLDAPAGIRIRSATTTWQVTGLFGDELDLALREPQTGLTLHRSHDSASKAWIFDAKGLDLGKVLELSREDRPLIDGGIADGQVALHAEAEVLRAKVDLGLRGTRLDSPAGDPIDLGLKFEGSWQAPQGKVEIPDLHATVAGAVLSGSLTLTDLDTDPAMDLDLGVQQLDFAPLLDASGLGIPDRLKLPNGATPALGTVSIAVQVRGRVAEPASLAVTQKIDFRPPRELPRAITELRGDFQFIALDGTGRDHPIDVSAASPDFIALREVPPLFLRTLLLAEDAGFYGHRGIDLRELPSAMATNWSRGGAARGASTLSQQLAKNLFLSREKQLGRKLQELAITFLLESAIGKDRILEIYLNIIEWGPDLRGLRPAARHYFGREPQALTPAQMAFLVSIIPGPILYQRSFASGTPAPGLRVLVDNLLTKLRSVDAISEAEYQQALEQPLLIGGETSVD